MRSRKCLVVWFSAVLLLVGCGCPLERGAHVAIHEAVAPEYVRYVLQDESLTQRQKDRRMETVRQWGRLIEALERADQRDQPGTAVTGRGAGLIEALKEAEKR